MKLKNLSDESDSALLHLSPSLVYDCTNPYINPPGNPKITQTIFSSSSSSSSSSSFSLFVFRVECVFNTHFISFFRLRFLFLFSFSFSFSCVCCVRVFATCGTLFCRFELAFFLYISSAFCFTYVTCVARNEGKKRDLLSGFSVSSRASSSWTLSLF